MSKAAAHAGKVLVVIAWVIALGYAAQQAYNIRLYAIKTYGRVIHEFDPWFNFRATKYLDDHGLKKFFTWFDYESWYPLGRPVGTTIYPGMQMTSVAIKNALKYTMKKPLSLNDVCCFVPAWFGVSATIFLGLLTLECSGSKPAAAASSLIMAIVPAHIMRSVGGGYDNESIALTAMCATFWCWVRALRVDSSVPDGVATKGSYTFGVLCGLCYIYMVAAWGGFVFVLNMIGVHAAALILLGRYTSKLHRAYTLFYVIGTFGAIQVPVVGWGPLKSLEQLAPLLVFVGMQGLEYCEVQRRKRNLTMLQHQLLRVKVAIPVLAVVVAVVAVLYPTGYFGPLSARVRGLFVKHTRTGNPLVDSVAEHQPANAQAYQQYLHHIYYLAPVGFGLSFLTATDSNCTLPALEQRGCRVHTLSRQHLLLTLPALERRGCRVHIRGSAGSAAPIRAAGRATPCAAAPIPVRQRSSSSTRWSHTTSPTAWRASSSSSAPSRPPSAASPSASRLTS